MGIFIGAIAAIGSVLLSVLTTKEYPPTEEELLLMQQEKGKNNILTRTFLDIKEAFVTMPLTMRQLIPVKFLPGMPCFAIGNT